MALRVWLPLDGNLNNYGISGATVTNNGATVDNSGKIGKCYSFSSSNSAYLQLPQWSINRSEMSFCIWAKYNAWDNWSRLFDFGATSGAGDTLLLSHNGTSNAFYVGCKTGGTSRDFFYAANLSLNTWYHFAIIKKGLEWKLYLNGSLVYTTNLVDDFSTDPVIFKNNFLGRSNWAADSYLNGQLNDFRIYDHALSPKEVKEISKGLVSHYQLKDGVSSAEDVSGYQHNGVITGTIGTDSDSPRYIVASKFTTAGTINAPRGMITVGNAPFTVNFWLKINSSIQTLYSDIINFGGNATIRLEHANTTGTSLMWFNYPIGTANGFGQCNPTVDTWRMMTLTCDGTKYSAYMDGTLLQSVTIGGTIWTPNGNVTIGDTAGSLFCMSDLRIYSTCLSTDDLKELFTVGATIDNAGNAYAYEFQED